jgi:hypothetical protein
MKKVMRPTLALANNFGLQCSKSSSSLLDFATYNDYKDDDDEDSILMLGKRIFATIFLLNQITCVKKLLQEANRKEGEYTPNMTILGEKTINLECNIRALIQI